MNYASINLGKQELMQVLNYLQKFFAYTMSLHEPFIPLSASVTQHYLPGCPTNRLTLMQHLLQYVVNVILLNCL